MLIERAWGARCAAHSGPAQAKGTHACVVRARRGDSLRDQLAELEAELRARSAEAKEIAKDIKCVPCAPACGACSLQACTHDLVCSLPARSPCAAPRLTPLTPLPFLPRAPRDEERANATILRQMMAANADLAAFARKVKEAEEAVKEAQVGCGKSVRHAVEEEACLPACLPATQPCHTAQAHVKCRASPAVCVCLH